MPAPGRAGCRGRVDFGRGWDDAEGRGWRGRGRAWGFKLDRERRGPGTTPSRHWHGDGRGHARATAHAKTFRGVEGVLRVVRMARAWGRGGRVGGEQEREVELEGDHGGVRRVFGGRMARRGRTRG
eukprot:1835027-Rhodomonas_salina.1